MPRKYSQQEDGMSVLADLEPRVIMDYFHTLTQIPRGSENEKGVSDWVVQVVTSSSVEPVDPTRAIC